MNERPIAFNKHYVFLGCGINGAVMLSQLVYWADKSKDPNGWIYKTGKEWTEETGLTRREQDTARKNLRELGFIEEHKHGVPCKVHFRVNQSTLYQSLINLAQKRQECAQISQTECTDQPNLVGGIRQTNTENTQESTIDIKTNRVYSEAFEKFWSEYPSCKRKGSKSDAFKTYKKFEKFSELIISVLRKFKEDQSFLKNDGEFIPAPSSWLNKKHWENEFWIEPAAEAHKEEVVMPQRKVVVKEIDYLALGQDLIK
jgi:hypothetical protein